MSHFAAPLTPAQSDAVKTIDGPLLVLAGPGSGKTLTVMRRLAAMLDAGIPASNILAVTFTNKAARELSQRLEALVGPSRVLVTTFHKFCARLLRQNASVVGLQSNYTILDVGDQRRLMSEVLDELDIDRTHYPADRVLSRISNAKNDLISPEQFAADFNDSVADHFVAVVARAYKKYRAALLASNAVDFDDLLLLAAQMLMHNEGLRQSLAGRYQYILVDEYQDTNAAQYHTISALAADHKNICVTGDPDQSIYGWRGARIENILNFERDFPNTKIVRLEANFRSTSAILETADALIKHNHRRKAKTLTTQNSAGDPVRLLKFDDGVAEADYIAEAIHNAVTESSSKWSDYAIFYRVNSLSRELERALTRLRVPYQVAQGTAFYDRAEVKDVLAYLRLLANPNDRTAFQRIVNKPARRLGQTSQRRLVAWADENGLSLFEAASRAGDCAALGKPARGGFRMFAETLSSVLANDNGSVAKLVRSVVDRTGYLAPFENSNDEKADEVVGNVEEIISAAADYDRRAGDESSLDGFLEESALVSETDALDGDESGRVTLMTLHAAKGLEFNNVFLIGLEQGLLPHERSLRENTLDDLEEERRLLFVGITRAREQLTLTHTAARATRGRVQISIQSQFTPEVIAEHVDLTTQLAGSAEYRAHRDGRRWNAEAEWEEPSVDINADTQRLSAESEDSTSQEKDESVDGTPGESSSSDDRPSLHLTTAADLLAGSGRRIDTASRYNVGQRVQHPHYGIGHVVTLGEVNRRSKVTVDFGEFEETFIVGLSPLQPLPDNA